MKRIANNLHFKIISLVLSLILWLYVTGELERGLLWKTKEVTFDDIPIRVMGLPAKEFNVDIKPDKANVVLYSYKRNAGNINRDDILLFVNLDNLLPATYELSIENIIPKDFDINKIEPARIIVTIFDKSASPFGSNTLIKKEEKQELLEPTP
ncbi:MAG: hypothetical protein PHW62_06960 [Candidatus Ratteibacteria bacterium]|nr:hypothetical protein [Candidatus Ratteibacteria bacterium]